MVRKSFNPDALNAGKQDQRWVDERLVHETQRRRYKSFAFWGVAIVCITLYAIFIAFLFLLLTHTVAMQMFVAHKHLAGLFISLLLVPSAMLWGLVRAVFRIDHQQENYADTAKAAMSIYPASGV